MALLLAAGLMSWTPSAFSQSYGRPGGNNHRGSSGNSAVTRPSAGSTNRPSTTIRPSNPGNNNNNNNFRPGNNGANGGNHGVNPGQQGGNNNFRPGNNGGNNNFRPGNPGHPGHPGGNGIGNNRPNHFGGNSVAAPGRPSYGSNYRPMRPNGGYWGAPPVNAYRPVFVVPPVPRRYTTVRVGIPTIGNILGLAFGSLIDAGINTLINGGYNVIGYANNAVYLSEVAQLGYMWPEATVYYNNGLMANAQFQYWTSTAGMGRFNSIYNQLSGMYGAPVEDSYINGMRTVSWWGGGNTGYVTLQYGYGNSVAGYGNYYTTLTYGM